MPRKQGRRLACTDFVHFDVESIGTLRYSGRGRGGRQPEVKCSILGIISIMPQRRPGVATVKTRSLAAS